MFISCCRSACGPSALLKPQTSCLQAIIDLELLGFVYHWGLEVNSITVIGELGVCLDLCVCHAVALQKERALELW